MIQLLDSTLREGEQTPGVKFSYSQKLEIAQLLDDFGVDFIEIGNPSISERDKNDLKKLAEEKFKAELLCHSRAVKNDIDNVIETGAEWIGIFAGVNELSLKHKFNKSREEVFGIIEGAIKYAKRSGLKVRFTPEDSSRTDWRDLSEAIRLAEKAGADRVSIADTVGMLTPTKTVDLVKKVKTIISLPINVHFHNDFGMAVANSLAAYEAGADLIDVSVNGLGERSGIASLSNVAVALKTLYGVKKEWMLKLLKGLSEKVAEYSGISLCDQAPIDGKHSFVHAAGLHTTALLKNKETYQVISPEILGRKAKIYIGELTSRKVFRWFLKKQGMPISETEFERLYRKLKKGELKEYHGVVEI